MPIIPTTKQQQRQVSPRSQHRGTVLLSSQNCLVFVGGILSGFILTCFVFFAYLGDRALATSGRTSSSHPPGHDNQESLKSLSRKRRGLQQQNWDDKNDGWSQLHIFIGNQSHILEASTIPKDYYDRVQWFSQLRQDYIVYKLLRELQGGFFVDLAANDAVRISNTYALERDHGWTGLCLEPNPIYWSSLSYRTRCTVVGAVVGGSQRMEEVDFKFASKGPESGILGPQFDNREAPPSNEHQKRFTIPLAEVLDRFQAPSVIDYLSLDVEGAENLVMQNFDFTRYRFNIMTIERPIPELERLLRLQDYIWLRNLSKWGETLWAHKDVDLDKSALDLEIPHYRERLRQKDMIHANLT